MHLSFHTSMIYNSPDMEAHKCPSTDEQKIPSWSILVFANGKLLSFLWLSNIALYIMPSEIIQTEKYKYYVLSRICVNLCWVQSSSVAQSCPTLCDPMNLSMPGLPVHHQLPEFTQTHVHWVSDPIQPSHPLSSPSPLALNPSQHQSLFQWVNSSHEVTKVLEFQL